MINNARPSGVLTPPDYQDTSRGLCLVLRYPNHGGYYGLDPDQCGHKKTFICQQLQKKHRSLFSDFNLIS